MRRLLSIVLLLSIAFGVAPVRAQGEARDLLTHYGPAMRPQFAADLVNESAGRPFYTMDVTLTIGEDAVRFNGTQTVAITNTSADTWNSVVFRLYPNLASFGGDLTVSAATVSDREVVPMPDASRTVLDVPLPEPLPPGEAVTVALDFQTTIIPGEEVLYNQFSYLEGILAAPDFYPVLSVYENGIGWWRAAAHPQGDAVYSETAFYDVRLTAPADLVVVTSGVTVAETRQDDTVTYAIVAPLMRDFALMASADYSVTSTTVDGIRVNVVSTESESRAHAGLTVAAEAVEVYNRSFGAYPFVELDVVETPTSAGGIEYPGVIVIADRAWEPASDYFAIVIAHEIAHQWWYSLVGNDQTRYPWLDESLTQYSVAVFYRETGGADAEAEFLAGLERAYGRVRGTADDLPIGLPVSAYDEDDAYFNIVYARGPLFFATLADLVGEETMLQMLADYFAAYRYEIAAPVDMLNSFEATLGRDDLDGIFRQWVGDFPGLQ